MADANHKAHTVISERFVTIQQSQRFQASWHKLAHQRPASTFYPWMKLAGRWIGHAGFVPSQRVKIAVEHGRLIITAA